MSCGYRGRSPKAGKLEARSGYYDDPLKLAAAAALEDQLRPSDGIYWTLNPVSRDLLARAANRTVDWAKQTTRDEHIVRRRFLLIDVDPIRPSGISASESEHHDAFARGADILVYLLDNGIKNSIEAISGNGIHLLIPVDQPNDANSELLFKQFLKVLAGRFDDNRVIVDQTTTNASRLVRAYGTWCRKGDSIEQRPHRQSEIDFVPEKLDPVPTEVLERLVANAAEEPATTTSIPPASQPPSAPPKDDLGGWPRERGLETGEPKDWQGGTLWPLQHCPWNAEHTGGSAWAAEMPDGKRLAGCHHDSCAGKSWRELHELLEPAHLDPKPVQQEGGERRSQATKLVQLTKESGAELFHTPRHEAFMTLVNGGHQETWGLRSRSVRTWLARRYYEEEERAPGSQSLLDAITVFEGEALFAGELCEVHVRIAEHDNHIYIDLGNDEWEAIEIDSEGWRVISDPPVRFRRPAGMLALPEPVHGGNIDELRQFVNASDEDAWVLLKGWLVGVFRPDGPFIVLVFNGERGSAKSTSAEVLRALIDPNAAPLRAEPREPRELMISAANGRILAFDNLSYMPP